MREQIAIYRKKLELIGSYSCDCVHDVWGVLIDGGCKTTCWAASDFDRLAARILDGLKQGKQFCHVYRNMFLVETLPSSFPTKMWELDG